MKTLRALLLVVLAAFAFAGCASTGSNSVTLPRLPAWQAPADARTFTAAEVFAETRKVAPLASVSYTDNRYTLVSYAWLEQFLSWTWAAAKADGLDYTAESFDCEDFADAFTLYVRRAAGRAGVKASPLAATLKVEQLATFANVPGQRGTYHAVVGVATDRGNVIVEPNPGAGAFRIVSVTKYPNPILEVNFGRR